MRYANNQMLVLEYMKNCNNKENKKTVEWNENKGAAFKT